MNETVFYGKLKEQFPHELTAGQEELLHKLAAFTLSREEHGLFILKGYAGTGKTTVISALVKALPAVKCKVVLLAPTGRAAKVLSGYSDMPAFTIHKKIYKLKSDGGEGGRFVLQQNMHKDTLFVVDEASMISHASGEMSGSLLDDLFEYVYAADNCRLIFVGDTAQLPPVGADLSPALDEKFLKKSFFLNIHTHELTEVVRQDAGSGILHNATQVRELIRSGVNDFPKLELGGFKDIARITGNDLEDALNYAYSKYGPEDTMVICRSNKRANLFNGQIRARIRWQEEELSAGDYMMVVKNNYTWLPKDSKAGFIANGDIIQVSKVLGTEEKYGFRFANVRMRMIDYPGEKEFEVKLMLNTIMSESPALGNEEGRRLYLEVNNAYLHIENRQMRYLKVRDDPYFNALQVKFSYAVTCHKAQGGQWGSVFVEQGYLTKEMVNREFLRWLYTALTRATERLYLVNFSDEFF
jgi:ATP-dependent exoDNAse (exonuclease V) alpha subunit